MKVYIVYYTYLQQTSVDSLWTSEKKAKEYAKLMNDMIGDKGGFWKVANEDMRVNNKLKMLPEIRKLN